MHGDPRKRTAAGVCSRSGMRSSAAFWFSTETPSAVNWACCAAVIGAAAYTWTPTRPLLSTPIARAATQACLAAAALAASRSIDGTFAAAAGSGAWACGAGCGAAVAGATIASGAINMMLLNT